MSTFLDYVRDISHGASNAEIARIAGVNRSTVGRWDERLPTVDSVRKPSRRYDRPLGEALIASGLLAPHELHATMQPDLRETPHHALLRELERRLDGMSEPPATIPEAEEDPNPDDYDLAAGHVDRPDDIPAD